MTTHVGLSPENLQRIRKQLEQERDRLMAQIAQAVRVSRENIGNNSDRADLASSYIRQDRRSALLEIEQTLLSEIETALQHLDAGTYGICTSCGAAIELERLLALPQATQCIRCQRQATP